MLVFKILFTLFLPVGVGRHIFLETSGTISKHSFFAFIKEESAAQHHSQCRVWNEMGLSACAGTMIGQGLYSCASVVPSLLLWRSGSISSAWPWAKSRKEVLGAGQNGTQRKWPLPFICLHSEANSKVMFLNFLEVVRNTIKVQHIIKVQMY